MRNAKGHPVLRPATAEDIHKLEEALMKLREARGLLREAGCPAATAAVRRALKSAEGAERHMERRASDARDRFIDVARVRTGANPVREVPLAAFLADWRLDRTSTLVDALRRNGWAGGGDVERCELVTEPRA